MDKRIHITSHSSDRNKFIVDISRKRIMETGKEIYGKHYLRVMIMIIVMSVIVVVYWITTILLKILDKYLDFSNIFIGFVLTIILGTALTVFVSRIILVPIKSLKSQMKRVAEGDFTTHPSAGSKIKEIQELYQEFNLMVEELSTTETLKSDFISAVSHEFKTPINTISGCATLLQSAELKEEERRYLDNILKNTQRLSDLVSNILLLSKLENQSIPAKRATFRLDEQIRQAVLSLEQKWTERENELDIDLADAEYSGNEVLLYQVWINLLDNAIKFSPKGGEIKVSLTKMSDGRLEIYVQDEGLGVNEEDVHRIFEKFYQADTSRKQDGNGLGLALVKHIIDAEKGEIYVENVLTGGSRFTVILNG